MIDLEEQKDIPDSPKAEDVYELLQSYRGRIARVRTTWMKEVQGSYAKTREVDQRFGRIQGAALLRRTFEFTNRTSAFLDLILEGQEKMPLRLETLVVEILQEDSQQWQTVYAGTKERENL